MAAEVAMAMHAILKKNNEWRMSMMMFPGLVGKQNNASRFASYADCGTCQSDLSSGIAKMRVHGISGSPQSCPNCGQQLPEIVQITSSGISLKHFAVA